MQWRNLIILEVLGMCFSNINWSRLGWAKNKFNDYARIKRIRIWYIFLPGWEEELFPHPKSIDEKGEGTWRGRRLAYVGITELKSVAIFFNEPVYQGDWIDSVASRFVDELPSDFIKKTPTMMNKKIKTLTLILKRFWW